jgi:hypothetical protein
MARFRGRPPKRRVTVRGNAVDPKGFFGAENFERIRQEIATEGTIDGEQLTPEQRKEAFKASRDKVAFKNFVENFLGVEGGPKTQVGRGPGGGGVGGPPSSGPAQRMLPGTATTSLVRRPTTQQRQAPEPGVEQVDVQDVTQKKRTKVGDSLEENVRIIRKTVDSIFKTLSDQSKFFGKQAERERKALENQRRAGKEEKFEEGKDKKFKKAFEKTVKPFSNILDGILNYLTALFLGRAFVKLMNWFADPDNQSKVESIGRFLKDWWPALLGAYLIFGNSLTRFALGFIAKIGMWTARMAVAVIPKLLGAIAKNPKAAAAVGLFTAGATIPMLFPQTVNEQERATEKAVAEKGANKVRAELERKANNPNFYERLTGQDAEAREQFSKMETGETKSYGFRRGGKITTQSGQDVKGAGVDTQLIAARPGEVVINKETVDRVGAGFFLSLNKKYGGPNANKPKVAKNVQAASGGGLVLPAFANGGMIGESDERPIGGTYMGRRGKELEKSYDKITKESQKPQSTGSLITDPMGALGRIASRTGVSIPNIGGFSLPQLNKMSFPSFGGDERPREPGKSSTGSFITDPIGALGRITSGTGMQIPRVPQVKIPPLPSLSTITSGMMGKPAAPKPPENQEPGIAESMLKSPTFRDSGLLYLRSMLGGLGGPITEQQLSKESKAELEKAIARAKLRTKSELAIATRDYERAKKEKWSNLAEVKSVYDRLKRGEVRVEYQDYYEKGKITKQAEDAKSILGKFWAQASSDGGYRVVNEKYDFIEMPDPLAVLRGDSTGVAKDAKPGQPITLRQKLQALHQLNPLARSMEVDMILGKKKGDPGRTLINTAKMIAMSTPLGTDIGRLISSSSMEAKTPNQKALEAKRPWWDKMGVFGGATGAAQREKKKKEEFLKNNPGATLYNKPKPAAKPKPKTNQQKLIEKRPWYDKFGWFGGASARIKKKQGGGITEGTGMNIPGATADRQLIATQPGEYILPVDTVMRLGGPNAIDRLVAATDSNSTAAKIGAISKPSMAVGQPVMSDDSSMVSTLPPIIQSSGGGYGGGGGVATKVPSVNVSSNSSRRNAKTMYGLV